jgi:hypothetical protein
MNRILLAGLLGGIAMFIWTHLSYTVLPLGNAGLRRLPNEAAVLEALQNNIAENSGIYLFPATWLGPNPPDKKAGATNDFAESLARYPSGVLMYNAAGARPADLSRWLSVEFLTELAEAVFAVFLLSRTRLTTFSARVRFVLLIGVVAAIATNISYWNWYGFPWSYTLAYMFNQLVGFLCVGLVAALVLKKQTFGAGPARRSLLGMSRAFPTG